MKAPKTRVTRTATWPSCAPAVQAAIFAILVMLFGAGSASAATASAAQNRVGVSQYTATVLVGSSVNISAGQRVSNDPPWAGIAVATAVAANSEIAVTRTFGSGAGPHTARVTVTSDGVSTRSVFTSGGMTADEAALGFPRSSLATHTEARTMTSPDIGAGDSVFIEGSYSPCPARNGAMNRVATITGADITYPYPGGVWTATAG